MALLAPTGVLAGGYVQVGEHLTSRRTLYYIIWESALPAGPFMSFEERVVSERLADYLAQDAQIMASVRPPIPMIGRVAPRFGLDHRVPGLAEVVRVDQTYKPQNGDPLVQRPGFTSSALPGWSSA